MNKSLIINWLFKLFKNYIYNPIYNPFNIINLIWTKSAAELNINEALN